MKTLLRAGALALASLLFACQPAMAQTPGSLQGSNVYGYGVDQLHPLPVSVTADAGGGATAANQTATGAAAQTVQGSVASGSTDAGNPVKTGSIYSASGNLTLATVGNRVDSQADAYGNLRVTLAGPILAPNATGTNVILPYARTSNQTTSNLPAPLGVLGFIWNGTNTIPQPGDANGAYMVDKGGSNMATGQASVTTASTLIAATRTGRQRITVSLGSANDCYFGNTGVTTTTGFRVKGVDGASLTINTAAAIYAVCSAATTISYVELY